MHRVTAALIILVGSLQMMYSAEATVPDQLTLEPGAITRIAITGSISEGGDVAVTIRYNPGIVRIVRAVGEESFALRCAAPDVSEPTISSATSASVTVRCRFSIGVSNDTLVVLDLQGVLGTDTVGTLGVETVSVEGVPISGLQANTCSVRRGGGSLGGYTIVQGITGTYPNPFRERTRVVFTMRAPGTVRCALRTYQGRIVTELPPLEATSGENAVELPIIEWQVAAGSYVVTLTTDEGTFYHPVTVMK